ncbi:autotransporter domain-containing protein [Pseudomonas batumici]|uniref:autotransporter outer membrane beta-barrel domain-containing protein n=1 Tax=Pseudomonas batumici TaxID=226910 RepID=UPI0030CC3B97
MFVKANFRKKLLALSIAAVVVPLQASASFSEISSSNESVQVRKNLHDLIAFDAKKQEFADDLLDEINKNPGLKAEKEFIERIAQAAKSAKVATVTPVRYSHGQSVQSIVDQLFQAKTAEFEKLRQAEVVAKAEARERAVKKWQDPGSEYFVDIEKEIENIVSADLGVIKATKDFQDKAKPLDRLMNAHKNAIAIAKERATSIMAKRLADAIDSDIREDQVVKEIAQQIAKAHSDLSEDNLAELASMDMKTWLTSRTKTGAKAKAELDAANARNQLLEGDLDELKQHEAELLAALKQLEDAEKTGIVTTEETGEAINDESAEINAELEKLIAQLELELQQALAKKKADEAAAKIAADDQQASANAARLTGNAGAASQAFVAAVQSGQIDRNDEIYQVFTDGSAEQVARLAGQLAPEVNGGVAQAAQTGHSLIAQATSDRTSTLRSGISWGETPMETGAWVQVLNSDANQGARQGVAGYKANSQGIAVGADGKLNEQVTLGVAYSHLGTEVKSDQGNKTDVTGHALTAYGSYEQDGYFVDGSLTFGQNANESTRQILDDRAKANYDSRLFGANVLAGYGFQLDNGVLVEPRVAGRYSHVSINGYQEKGSSAALSVKGQTVEVMELGAGVRVAGQFPLKQGTLEPEVKLMAYHDFKADRASSTSAFVQGGTPFVTDGAKPTSNSIEAGVGLNYRTGASTFGVSYDYLSKKDFDADSVQLKARYDF